MQEEKGKKFGEKVLDSINLPAQLVASVTKTERMKEVMFRRNMRCVYARCKSDGENRSQYE